MLDATRSRVGDVEVTRTLRPLESSSSATIIQVSADQLARRLAAERPRQIRFLRSRLPSLEDAEDAWQDASIKFLQNAEALVAAERPEAWMGASLRRLVVDRYRRAAVRRRTLDALAAQPAPGEGDDEDGPPSVPDHCLKAALRDLKAPYREILAQAYLEERPVTEIAGRLGLTANNAAVRLHRARAALRQAMAGRCQACPLADCWARTRAPKPAPA